MNETGAFFSKITTYVISKNKLEEAMKEIGELMNGLIISDADLFLYELNNQITTANQVHSNCKEMKLIIRTNERGKPIYGEVEGVMRIAIYIVQGYHDCSEIEHLPEAVDKLIRGKQTVSP